MSVYSGSAWQWYQDRQEYLLHQFWKTEPDLNYANPNIIQEMSVRIHCYQNQLNQLI